MLHVQDGAFARERLDAAHAGGHATLLHDREQADVAGGAAVRAPAQLHAEVRDRDHADGVAVLLAEERHRPGGHGFVARPDVGGHRSVAVDLRVDDPLDLALLRRCHRSGMHEVEAEPIRRHQRTGLLDVRPEHLAQGRVQQVRGGVVAACGVADHVGRPPR